MVAVLARNQFVNKQCKISNKTCGDSGEDPVPPSQGEGRRIGGCTNRRNWCLITSEILATGLYGLIFFPS